MAPVALVPGTRYQVRDTVVTSEKPNPVTVSDIIIPGFHKSSSSASTFQGACQEQKRQYNVILASNVTKAW